MSASPLPEGNNAAEMIRRLRAIDAEIFGTLYVNAGIIGGDVEIQGDLIANDIYSEDWVSGGGTVPLALPDVSATTGYALQSDNGRGQFTALYATGENITDLVASEITVGQIATGQIEDLAINRDKIANLAVDAGKIEANTITAGQIFAGTITATEILSETITALQIAAGTIDTSRLVVGSFSNLVPDPGLETGTFDNYGTTVVGGTWSIDELARSGNWGATYEIAGDSGDANIWSGSDIEDSTQHPAAVEGDKFSFSVWIRPGGTGSGVRDLSIMIRAYDIDGVFTGTFGSTTYENATGFVFSEYTTTVTCPADTAYVVPYVRIGYDAAKTIQSYAIDDWTLRQQVGTIVMEDGAITAEQIETTLGLRVGQTLQSTIFTPGSAGWGILADGSAEFNNVLVRGEIDALTGTLTDLTISGKLTMDSQGEFRSGPDGNTRLQILGEGATPTIAWFHESASLAYAEITGIGSASELLVHGSGGTIIPTLRIYDGSAAAPSLSFNDDHDTGLYHRAGVDELGFATDGVGRGWISAAGDWRIGHIADTGKAIIRSSAGDPAAMTYAFEGDLGTGMYRGGVNLLRFGANGSNRLQIAASSSIPSIGAMVAGGVSSPAFGYTNDPNTGIYFLPPDQLAITVGGVKQFGISTAALWIPVTWSATTGTAANLNVANSVGQIRRFTSARKYKSRINYNMDYLADIELKPAKFYRKDDKRWFIGMIADDLGGQNELLGVYADDEIENFDTSAVLAVLAAKINRLEAQVQELSK